MTGQTTAPAPRLNKRKATVEDVGRVPTSFTPPVESEGNTSMAQQTTLAQSWGQSKITAVRQALIDYHLLWFVVCCSIAFAVVDSGFFMDFVSAL
jgi:hypothetical protein